MLVSGRELINQLNSKGLNHSFILDWHKSLNQDAYEHDDVKLLLDDIWVKVDSIDLTASLVNKPLESDSNMYCKFNEVVKCLAH